MTGSYTSADIVSPERNCFCLFSCHYHFLDKKCCCDMEKQIIRTFIIIDTFGLHWMIYPKSPIVVPDVVFFILPSENVHGH